MIFVKDVNISANSDRLGSIFLHFGRPDLYTLHNKVQWFKLDINDSLSIIIKDQLLQMQIICKFLQISLIMGSDDDIIK